MKGCLGCVILFGFLVGCSDTTEDVLPEEDTLLSTEDVAPISGPGSEEDPCSLPILVGPCEAAMPRFGYNPELNECLEFTYGGCDGNSNRFLTVEECETLCVTPPEDNDADDDGLQEDPEDAETEEPSNTDVSLDGEGSDEPEIQDATESDTEEVPEPDTEEVPEPDTKQDGESDGQEPVGEDVEQEETENGTEP
jgi:hypothetical protein